MHPAKLLDRRQHRRELVSIDGAAWTGERDAVLQRKESCAARLLVIDGKANEVLRGFALLPVHRKQRHSVTAMDFQREQRGDVRSEDLKVVRHVRISAGRPGCAYRMTGTITRMHPAR